MIKKINITSPVESDKIKSEEIKSFMGLEELKCLDFYKALLAEFLSMFLLVLVGCGTIPHGALLSIALVWGLMVATLAQVGC